jgi:hypothetical protein
LTAFGFLWERAKKLELIRISGQVVMTSTEDDNVHHDVVFTKDRIELLLKLNSMHFLNKFDIAMTLSSIDAANRLLELLPKTVQSIGILTVTVAIQDSTVGVAIGDAVASVLRQMVEFKLACKRREVEYRCQIKWTWKHEGILNILLQQQIMASVSELIQP